MGAIFRSTRLFERAFMSAAFGVLALSDSEKRYRHQALQFRGIGQLLHWRALLATILWR